MNCWIAVGHILYIHACIWVNLCPLHILPLIESFLPFVAMHTRTCTLIFVLVTLQNQNYFDWTFLMKKWEAIVNDIFWSPQIHLNCIFPHRLRWIEIYTMHKRHHSKRFDVDDDDDDIHRVYSILHKYLTFHTNRWA